MANSRLLLRTCCNSKAATSFVGSSSVIMIRCSTTPAKGLGFNGSDRKININGSHQSNEMYLNKDHHSGGIKASVAAASSGGLVTSAATQPQEDDGGVFMLLRDHLVSLVFKYHAWLRLLRNKANLMINQLRTSFQKMHLQIFFERVLIDCRFFTLFAVAGSLLASILCFVEGCFIVLESYIHYFHTLSQKADQGHVMQLLIEAIDMFLVGTAMLIFGVGLYTMFLGSKSVKEEGSWPARSNLFGLFYMKRGPRWIEMKSVSEAKSKLGHAVTMILQVGVMEKFKSVPLVTGTDLACFAATLLFSSASIFLLSKLSHVSTVAIKK